VHLNWKPHISMMRLFALNAWYMHPASTRANQTHVSLENIPQTFHVYTWQEARRVRRSCLHTRQNARNNIWQPETATSWQAGAWTQSLCLFVYMAGGLKTGNSIPHKLWQGICCQTQHLVPGILRFRRCCGASPSTWQGLTAARKVHVFMPSWQATWLNDSGC